MPENENGSAAESAPSLGSTAQEWAAAGQAAESLRLALLRNEDFTGEVDVLEHEDGGPVLLAKYKCWPDSIPPKVYQGIRCTYYNVNQKGRRSR